MAGLALNVEVLQIEGEWCIKTCLRLGRADLGMRRHQAQQGHSHGVQRSSIISCEKGLVVSRLACRLRPILEQLCQRRRERPDQVMKCFSRRSLLR